MRNIIYAINVTIDGCCDHTKSTGSDVVLDYFTNLMQDVDLLLYGRKTYELMVPFWPDIAKNKSGQTKATNEFAQAFDAIDIAVVSKTLETVEEKNTKIIRSNLKEEILKLKQEKGKNILTGGVHLPSQLIELGLVDEYRIIVHPIVAGEGTRVLDGTSLSN